MPLFIHFKILKLVSCVEIFMSFLCVLKSLIHINWILKVLFLPYHPHRWAWQGSRYKYSPEGERIGWICPGWWQASWRAKESKEEQRQICWGFLRQCWRIQIQWVSKTDWHLSISLASWVYFKNHWNTGDKNAILNTYNTEIYVILILAPVDLRNLSIFYFCVSRIWF